MSIVALFNRLQPEIGGIYFDALLEETSELRTEVSEYPLEYSPNTVSGTIGTANDNAVTYPLMLVMRVAVSDNPVKTMIAKAGEYPGLLSIGAGVTTGAIAGLLSGQIAAIAGIGATLGQSAASQAVGKRSVTVLSAIRDKQSKNAILTVVGDKGTYSNMIITNTRTTAENENEGGLELVVEMRQLRLMDKDGKEIIDNSKLPIGDTATTQAQATTSVGEVETISIGD